MERKLTSAERHILKLISKSIDDSGSAPVSRAVMPIIEAMPMELVSYERRVDGTGRAVLTSKGKSVLEAMEWL